VGKLAGSVSAAATAAAEQAEQAASTATERLTEAATALDAAVKKMKKDAKAAGYVRLIGVHEAMAALTGEQTHIDQVGQLRQALQELQAPAPAEE
jgi:hypothetical protein